MSDGSASGPKATDDRTIAQIIERCEPMGKLDGLVIDDLTEEDEGEFFGILENL